MHRHSALLAPLLLLAAAGSGAGSSVAAEEKGGGDTAARTGYVYAGQTVWVETPEHSCLRWYAGASDPSHQSKPDSLHGCQKDCDAAAESRACEFVHYFVSSKICMMFNQSECGWDGQPEKGKKNQLWEDLVGPNSAWRRVNISKTYTLSLTETGTWPGAVDGEQSNDGAAAPTKPEEVTASPSNKSIPHRPYEDPGEYRQRVHAGTLRQPSILLTPVHALYLFAPLLLLMAFLYVYQHVRFRRYRDEMLMHNEAREASAQGKDMLAIHADHVGPACVEVKRPPSEWQRGRMLGRGSFGKVYIALCPDGGMLAVKTIELGHNLSPGQLKAVTKEIQVLSDLDHESIVSCIGCRFDPIVTELQIFMEYMPGGSLGQLVRKLGTPLRESTAASYVRQAVSGVAYMHSKSIVHRDIKGDNILVGATGAVKLADFGASSYLSSEVGCLSGDQTTCNVGTPLWMAPEVIAKASKPTTASDIWAVGIVTCELLNQGKTPWATFDNNMQALYHIARWQLPLPGPNLPADLSAGCCAFLKRCHDLSPTARPSAALLLEDEWLTPQRERACTSPSPIIETSHDLQAHYNRCRDGSDASSGSNTRASVPAVEPATPNTPPGGDVASAAVAGASPQQLQAQAGGGAPLAMTDSASTNPGAGCTLGVRDFTTVSLVSTPDEEWSSYEGSRAISPPVAAAAAAGTAVPGTAGQEQQQL